MSENNIKVREVLRAAQLKKQEMTSGETLWYYIINIFTLASLYFIKTAVKKAMSEIKE